jgi:hypothetical protein
MEREEIDSELAAAQELLASTSAAHLAYTAIDGTPRVVVVGFYWTGDEFVISTAATAPKVAALAARPEVALAIDAGETPGGARSLSVRGRASVEIVDGVVPEYLAAARRSMDTDAAAKFEQNARRDHADVGALLRLRCRPDAALPAGARGAEPDDRGGLG